MTSEGWVEHAGHRTWYRIAGDLEAGADPLLCLHGGPGSTHHYFAPLERLADKRAVVVYDQLGCGESDRPTDVEWTLQVFLDELQAVREQLGLLRIHLLGTSWGGMLALEHALSGAGGLTSLVLSSTLASADDWARETKRLASRIPSDDPEEIEAEFERRHFYRSGPEPPEIQRMRRERGTDVYEAMWGPNEWTITGALLGWDVRARLPEIHVPALVLRGRYDMSTEPIAATLLQGIPGARGVVLEHSSHTPVLEESDRYLEIVGAFLRESEAGRRS